MAKVVKVGNMNVVCFSKSQLDRLPNAMGKNERVFAPATLTSDKRYSSIINEDSVSALNNYARHKNIEVYFTPLKEDLFDDLGVSVFSGDVANRNKSSFAVKFDEDIAKFFRTIYKQVEDFANKQK